MWAPLIQSFPFTINDHNSSGLYLDGQKDAPMDGVLYKGVDVEI